MKDKMAKISLLYKLLIVIVTGIGLYLNFKFITFQNGIVYFTIQSNLLCFMFYLVWVMLLVFHKQKPDDKYYMVKGLVTTSITLTMVIYNILLATGNINAYDGHLIECIFVHYLVPLMIICDYFVFEEKGHVKYSYPLIWSIGLIFYGIFYIVYVTHGGDFVEGNYAYSFLNVDKFGLIGVVANCLIIYMCFVLFGYIVLYFDNKKGRMK